MRAGVSARLLEAARQSIARTEVHADDQVVVAPVDGWSGYFVANQRIDEAAQFFMGEYENDGLTFYLYSSNPKQTA